MAKIYKATVYILDLENNSAEDIQYLLTSNKHLNAKVGELKQADVEWHDDHELNKRGADWEKFFK